VVPTHAAHHATDTTAADDAYSTSRPGPTEDIESAEPRAAHPATNSAGRPSAARSRRHASVSNFQTAQSAPQLETQQEKNWVRLAKLPIPQLAK
jgi:hypothetical protein